MSWYGAYNYEVASAFLQNLCTSDLTLFSSFSYFIQLTSKYLFSHIKEWEQQRKLHFVITFCAIIEACKSVICSQFSSVDQKECLEGYYPIIAQV